MATRGDADGGKGARTRQAILDAAIERFGREGYRATSVADIARDAGVGGTTAYAYFAGKEALFLAALDEDAAGVVEQGMATAFRQPAGREMSAELMLTLLAAVEEHPLARRVLAGLEPHATDRMIEIPALAELRKAVATRLRNDQVAGLVRADIDPVAVANGTVVISLALLMSVLQLGVAGELPYVDDVLAVFEAAVSPPT